MDKDELQAPFKLPERLVLFNDDDYRGRYERSYSDEDREPEPFAFMNEDNFDFSGVKKLAADSFDPEQMKRIIKLLPKVEKITTQDIS